jgi:hypothetical protein
LTATRLTISPTGCRAILGCFATARIPALSGIESSLSRSVIVQPSGPRQDEAGRRFFNVEGSKNDRYASFAVLAFE